LNFVDPSILPAPGKDQNDFLKKMSLDFYKKLMEDFKGEVLFASANRRPDKGKLMLEFRLDSVEAAREIRKLFSTRRIAKTLPEGFDNLQVMTVVTYLGDEGHESDWKKDRNRHSDRVCAYLPAKTDSAYQGKRKF
jgi:hypothetical protein